MYYYGARYYDPRISIFVSVDPLAEQFQGWTPYHYVHNNPIMLIDPTGMSAEEGDGIENRYKIYRRECGAIEKIEHVNNDGGDETDYITEVNVDAPMMDASSTRSYTTSVERRGTYVNTNLSSLNGSVASMQHGPGYRNYQIYKAQSQAIQPMGFDSPFFVVGGVASKLLNRGNAATEMTTVGRWMSKGEYSAMKNGTTVLEGAGGQTFVTQGGSHVYSSAARGSVYAEFQVPANSLLQGGKEGWFKMLGPNASKSQQYLLQKQGGTLLPQYKNLSPILKTK